jgi:hypothetical protein
MSDVSYKLTATASTEEYKFFFASLAGITHKHPTRNAHGKHDVTDSELENVQNAEYDREVQSQI